MQLTKRNRWIWLYVCLITAHVAHIIEESLGGVRFTYLQKFNYLFPTIEFSFLLIPVVLLYLTVHGSELARRSSYIYAVIMILDGIYHVATYLHSQMAGVYTGLLMLILSCWLILSLPKNFTPAAVR